MAKSATAEGIILSPEVSPAQLKEGIVDGTPLPGTVMQIKAATATVGGRHTWEAFNRDADGNRPQGPLAILREDYMQGKTIDDAYVDGTRCFLFIPRAGDEFLVRWSKTGTGTGDAVAIGALGIVNDGDGLIIDTTGTPESEPVMAMEAISDVTSTGTLVWVIATGY